MNFFSFAIQSPQNVHISPAPSPPMPGSPKYHSANTSPLSELNVHPGNLYQHLQRLQVSSLWVRVQSHLRSTELLWLRGFWSNHTWDLLSYCDCGSYVPITLVIYWTIVIAWVLVQSHLRFTQLLWLWELRSNHTCDLLNYCDCVSLGLITLAIYSAIAIA